MAVTILTIIGSGLTIVIMVLQMVNDHNAQTKAQNDAEKKKISDDIASDDLGRFNDTVNGLRT